MTAEQIFRLANLSVLPVWLLLLVAPRWRGTEIVAGSCVVSLLIAVVYALLIGPALWHGKGDMASLAGIQLAFSQPQAALVGWLHYLTFDLFIGGWESRNARKLGIPHLLVIPCLLCTFLLGPVGLLMYFLLRWAYGARLLPGDGSAG